MSIDIEPIEVLAHLHNLGYYDVSSEQLLAFVADLKKLIKYDAKKCNCSHGYASEQVHGNEQSVNSSETLHCYLQNSMTLLCDDGRFKKAFHCDKPSPSSHDKICAGGRLLIANKVLHTLGHSQKSERDLQSDNTCSSNEYHIGSNPLNQVPSSLDHSQTASDISKENAEMGFSYGRKANMKTSQRNKYEPSVDFCICGRKPLSGSTKCEKTCNNSKEERKRVLQSNRCMSSTGSRSAFIKPWQLQVPLPQRKSDPVALYHKYQAIWQQQKLPGDNHHDNLRWNVRAKMLGGDPHPRPISRATSAERVNRPAWNFR